MDRYLSGSFIRLLVFVNVYLITDCRCVSHEITLDTNRFVYVAGFYSQLASKGIRTGSVQVVVYLERHLVLFEYFMPLYILYICNSQTTSHFGMISGKTCPSGGLRSYNMLSLC